MLGSAWGFEASDPASPTDQLQRSGHRQIGTPALIRRVRGPLAADPRPARPRCRSFTRCDLGIGVASGSVTTANGDQMAVLVRITATGMDRAAYDQVSPGLHELVKKQPGFIIHV